MKIVVATYGTEGHARPFAALCRGLIDSGHEARLLADSATLGSARALTVPSTSLAGDIRAALGADHAAAGVIAKGGGLNATTRALAKIANDNTESWLRTTVEVGEGADAILAAGLAAFIGFSAAEYVGAQSIGSGMIPITPTAAFPSPFLPPKRVPRLFYRASHRFVNAMLWKAFREKTNQARALFRMPPRKKVWTEQPMMYGVSPTLLDTPRDWPGNVYVCGQWLASSAAWAPPPELANFLAAGEPPIYIGFGSMTGFDSTHLLDALVKAMAGRRALFYPGWSGITSEALPGNFFAIGDTPHDWLFSRISAVVHHGGSGTSHSATRAGAPSIVIPFAGDQFFRAERLRQAGVAPDPVDGRRPSADAIERALAFVADARVCERARALGEAMRAENGVANAVALIERIVATWKSGAAKSAIRLS